MLVIGMYPSIVDGKVNSLFANKVELTASKEIVAMTEIAKKDFPEIDSIITGVIIKKPFVVTIQYEDGSALHVEDKPIKYISII
jgi:hypothetical protein